MALIDILKGRKREEQRPKRLSKGALKGAKKPAKKRAELKIALPEKKEIREPVKTIQSALASKFILRPHITEQSTFLAKQNVYTFRVSPSANKIIIKKAIKEMCGFEPIKIHIINVPLKKRIVRGKVGIKSGYKKALVYLKESDKIEFI